MQLQQNAQQTCRQVTDGDDIICGMPLTDAILRKKKQKRKEQKLLKVSTHINGLNSVQKHGAYHSLLRKSHATGQLTDRQADFSSLDRVCIPCSAVKTHIKTGKLTQYSFI